MMLRASEERCRRLCASQILYEGLRVKNGELIIRAGRSVSRVKTARRQLQAASVWAASADDSTDSAASDNLTLATIELELALKEEARDRDELAGVAKELHLLENQIEEISRDLARVEENLADQIDVLVDAPLSMKKNNLTRWVLDVLVPGVCEHGKSFSILEAAAPNLNIAISFLNSMEPQEVFDELAACARSKKPEVDEKFIKWFSKYYGFTSGTPPVVDGRCLAFFESCLSHKFELAKWMFVAFGLADKCDHKWLLEVARLSDSEQFRVWLMMHIR